MKKLKRASATPRWALYDSTPPCTDDDEPTTVDSEATDEDAKPASALATLGNPPPYKLTEMLVSIASMGQKQQDTLLTMTKEHGAERERTARMHEEAARKNREATENERQRVLAEERAVAARERELAERAKADERRLAERERGGLNKQIMELSKLAMEAQKERADQSTMLLNTLINRLVGGSDAMGGLGSLPLGGAPAPRLGVRGNAQHLSLEEDGYRRSRSRPRAYTRSRSRSRSRTRDRDRAAQSRSRSRRRSPSSRRGD